MSLSVSPPLYMMSPPREDWCLRGKANFRSRAVQGDRIDARAARAEWTALADAIARHGGRVLVLPPHPTTNMTGLIYTAEAGMMSASRLRQGAPLFLLPRMAPAHRREEASWIKEVVTTHFGWDVLCPTTQPWEAQGDAIALSPEEIICTYGEGAFARTSRAGLQEALSYIAPTSCMLMFKADPWFHGNTFLNVYHHATDAARRVVMIAPEAISASDYERLKRWVRERDEAGGYATSFFDISKQESVAYATNSLQVQRAVLAPQSVSARCLTMWEEELELDVELLDLGQLFVRGGGAPVCLTCRLHHVSDEETWPSAFMWRAGASLKEFERLIPPPSTPT